MKPKHYWAVMRLQPWSSITVNGVPLGKSESGQVGFIPVFATKAVAVRFGGKEHAQRLQETKPTGRQNR